jgi:hypothetical protein
LTFGIKQRIADGTEAGLRVGVLQIQVRLRELRVIGDVRRLGAELQLEFFSQQEVLEQPGKIASTETFRGLVSSGR